MTATADHPGLLGSDASAPSRPAWNEVRRGRDTSPDRNAETAARSRAQGSGAGNERAAGPPPLAGGSGAGLSFDVVYEEHFDFVWRSLRLLGIPEEGVEDAVQDTFSVVSRQLPSFEGRSSIRTWLFAILRRVAANQRRRRIRKQSPLALLIEPEGNEPTPHAYAEAAEAARLVQSFCERLAPAQRALFVLAVLENLPAREVSAALGVPVANIYTRVHALREGLRQALTAAGARHG